jgi:hypothetical protein
MRELKPAGGTQRDASIETAVVLSSRKRRERGVGGGGGRVNTARIREVAPAQHVLEGLAVPFDGGDE